MKMKDDSRVFDAEVQLYVVEVVLHLVLLFTCAANMSTGVSVCVCLCVCTCVCVGSRTQH